MWRKPPSENCSSCAFWGNEKELEALRYYGKRGNSGEGACLRYPPTAQDGRPPTTIPGHWCGEYRNAETHEPSKVMRSR